MRDLCRRRDTKSVVAVFRRAGPNDVTIIRNVTREAYAKWVPLIGREPKPMAADHAHAVMNHIIDIHERLGEAVGLVEVIPLEQHLLIESIAVLPAYQGQGIGKLLLVHAENLASSLGLGEVRLYTNAAFASNIAFYARRGYADFLHERLVDGGTAVHMKKEIMATPPK